MSALNMHDIDAPCGLSPNGRVAYRAIVRVLKSRDGTYTGGCTTFYTPESWRERGERYGSRAGENADLIVVYDGGEVGRFFRDEDGESARDIEAMRKALGKVGFYAEECTNTSSAIYWRGR